MEKKEREILIGKSRYYFSEDNILHATIVGEVDDSAAAGYRDAAMKFINMSAGTINVLGDITKAGKLSPEARKVFRELTEHETTGKVAIFGLHPVARVIASFFMGTTKKKDIRFFSSREEAIAWLKE